MYDQTDSTPAPRQNDEHDAPTVAELAATPIAAAEAPKGSSSWSRWSAFHAANPHVYALLVTLAREYKARVGNDRLSVSLLFQRARWEIMVQTSTTDSYRLNDHYVPYYAREIMGREADLLGAFELRRSQADHYLGRPGYADDVAA